MFGSIDTFQERRRDDSFRVAHRLYQIKYSHRNSAILVHRLELDAIEFTSSVPSVEEGNQILRQARETSSLLVDKGLLVYCGMELGSVEYHTRLSTPATRDIASLIDAATTTCYPPHHPFPPVQVPPLLMARLSKPDLLRATSDLRTSDKRNNDYDEQ